MKKLFFLASICFTLAACTQADQTTENRNVDKATAPILSFTKESHDFGQITEGDTVRYEFYFTNTGKTPLIISNATATCGCTQPKYPKEPVAPGEKGSIHVVFNSSGKQGMQNKVITLTTNTYKGTEELHLVGDVKPKTIQK